MEWYCKKTFKIWMTSVWASVWNDTFWFFNVKSKLVILVQKYFLKDGWVVYLCPFKNLFFVYLDLYKGYILLSYLQRSKQQQQIMATIINTIIAPKITSPTPIISIFIQNKWGLVVLLTKVWFINDSIVCKWLDYLSGLIA